MFRRKVNQHPSSDVLAILDGDTATANKITDQIDDSEAPDVVSLMELMTTFSDAVTDASASDLPEQTYRGLRRDQFAALLALLHETTDGIDVILDSADLDPWAIDRARVKAAREGLNQASQALFEIVTDLVADGE
jgi:hypothetical protein